jgi:hypothetical protein
MLVVVAKYSSRLLWMFAENISAFHSFQLSFLPFSSALRCHEISFLKLRASTTEQ